MVRVCQLYENVQNRPHNNNSIPLLDIIISHQMLCHRVFIQCLDTSNDNYIVEHLFMYSTHHPSMQQDYG